jgi:thiamine-monophosphate kinase
MAKENKVNEIKDLGEFGLIRHLTSQIQPKNQQTIYGIGDDAAVLDYKSKRIVVTTDMLVEGIHFDLVYTPIKHLGYKAVVVNLSDVYAMNAQPKQITVSIAFSAKFSLQAIEQLYEGIHLACEKYGIDLVGGDTTSSMTGLVISVTAIGEVEEGKAVYRNGAQKNDLICVSGDLGAAYMGLQLLEREKKVFVGKDQAQPQLETYGYILQRQLKPEARKDIVEGLDKAGIVPTSMIDISDGLSSELSHLCKQSKLGCSIYEQQLPYHPKTQEMAKELGIETIVAMLNGGEDYELLFTVPLGKHENVAAIPGVSVIGHMTGPNEGLNLVTLDGRAISLPAGGWNAFPV